MKIKAAAAAALLAAAAVFVPVCGESEQKDNEIWTEEEFDFDVVEEETESENGHTSTDEAVPAAEESDSEPDTIASHVFGIRDFSIICGMQPDVMAGITWDDTIASVEADLSSVDWNRTGVQILRYYISAADGQMAMATLKVTICEDLDLCLYGMEGEAVIEIGESFDPMEGVTYSEEIASVEADTSALDVTKAGRYMVTYKLTAQDGRAQTSVRQVTVSDGTYTAGQGFAEADGSYAEVVDLGLWRLTAYMDTPEDQGIYVGKTASGAPLVAGRTVAVSSLTMSRLGLEFGDELLIDGHIYVLEDHGGSAMKDQNWVDIFVDNKEDEYSSKYNCYTEVYLLR